MYGNNTVENKMQNFLKNPNLILKKLTREKIEARVIVMAKNALHTFGHKVKETTPVFIMGYGRSGSTMLFKVFERDLRIDAFGENHPAVARNYLLQFDLLKRTLKNSKYKTAVFKPILNSFDISRFLSIYPQGVYIWLVRDYQDVVASAITKFGTRVADHLRMYIEHGKGDNWIANGLTNGTRNKIKTMTQNLTLKAEDWMALVWWAVNHTIIEKKLYRVSNLYIIRYENFVSNPEPVLRTIYQTAQLTYKKHLGKYVHKRSIGKGGNLNINPRIKKICTELNMQISMLAKTNEFGENK